MDPFYDEEFDFVLKHSQKRTAEQLTPKFGREICTSSRPAVEDLQDSSTDDLQCSLQSTLEAVFKRYRKRDEQFDNLQDQLITAKEEIKQVKQKWNNVSDDYHKTTNELQNTKQMLDQKNYHIINLQTKIVKLKAELQSLADEKTEKCKELDGLKKILQRKETAFNRFIKEFSGKQQSWGQGKVSSKEASNFDGSSNCSICMEPWTESGEHNICSLSCGHFFGRSCITKWINKATLGLSTCPCCLKSASLGDLRQHYVQRVCIADEKKTCADDGNIPQGQPSLTASRNGVGGNDISDGDGDDEGHPASVDGDDDDDEGDNEEDHPTSVDGDDDDDEGDNQEGDSAGLHERSLEDEDDESDNE